MSESPMSETFHDWLEQCPVQWFRTETDETSATYTFIDNIGDL